MQTKNPTSEVEPRNQFVLRIETGHPGYRNTVILGTKSGLSNLANSIQSTLDGKSSSVRVDHYVTREYEPTSLGAIAFQSISGDELISLQKLPAKQSFLNWIRRLFWIGALVFSIIGIRTFWLWLTR
jgi:hypothetical protein